MTPATSCKLFAISVELANGRLVVGSPTRLFDFVSRWGSFAVSPTGDRFYYLDAPNDAGQLLTVLTDWRTRLGGAAR